MAGWTRLELATSAVTGQRSNRLSYHPSFVQKGGWIIRKRRVFQQVFFFEEKNCTITLYFLMKNMIFQQDVLLEKFSTLRIGGPAAFVADIVSPQELQESAEYALSERLPLLAVGSGSNVLFSDDGFRGILLHLQNHFILDRGNGIFEVGAGVLNSEFFETAREKSFDFSRFFPIPGTLGGAVAGNAGIPGCEIGDFVISAMLFDTKKANFIEVPKSFFEFSYRCSVFKNEAFQRRYVIWSVKIHLQKRSGEEIDALLKKVMQVRQERQPWGKTAGSFFKNPPEAAAGHFLEQVGAKLLRVGDAEFSDKHANFVMNKGFATQKDVLELARMAAKKVHEEFGIRLEPEVRIYNERGEIIAFTLE
jgi:UDP-N-acetylmuramate dehydrogenase